MWFTFNCIFPGKVKANDEAQQTLGLYSLKCLKKLEVLREKKNLTSKRLTFLLASFHVHKSVI